MVRRRKPRHAFDQLEKQTIFWLKVLGQKVILIRFFYARRASDLNKKNSSRKVINSKDGESDGKMEDIDTFTVRNEEIEETGVNDDEVDNGKEAIGDGVVRLFKMVFLTAKKYNNKKPSLI